ncbi:BatA domain-containing protein [uncultured Roseivirga sp.]|uniref:BatA domain-containing protein n=1 Tax=uncultured Roseivirga sp. TaxID=543088 RepID=UPI0030DDBD54
MTIYTALTFANPAVLWGLLALAIPVIIHLFNFRRVKRVQFSNIALLKKVKEESSSKRKPVELLILLSRLLFLAFLILAFAQPIFKDNANDQELSDEVLIYLDNSLSMDMPVSSQQSAFDRAYSLSTGVVDAYPESAKFKFLENGYGNSLNTSYTASTIKDRFTELELSGVGRSMDEIQSRIAASGFRGDVYLISDFQKSRENELGNIASDSLRNYYLMPIEGENNSNLYFDTAYLENSFLLGAMKNNLKVVLKNEGAEDFEDVNVRLFFDDQLSSTALVNVPANGIKEHIFEVDQSATGLNKAKVTLDDSKVLFDNEYFLTLNNIERVIVHEVKGPGSNDFIEQLYADNELFNYQAFNANNIDNNELLQSDIIILNQLSDFSNQLISALKTFLEKNGTVLIIPSAESNFQTFSQLGLTIRFDSDERLGLGQPNFQNPFFDGVFENTKEAIAMPEASITYRLINSELGVLNFKNGREFLSKAELPLGNAYVFSSDFSAEATSFPSHSLFVPVMYKLALGSKVNLSKLYYLTDEQTMVYPLEESLTANDIVTLSDGENKITPDQRISGKSLIMEIPKDELKAGHYNILKGETELGTIAFNQSKAESSVDRHSIDELETIAQAKNINLIQAEDGIEVNRELTAGIKGINLWKYALMLGLLFLFAEVILIRYL